jgi:hypothetical protein
MPHPPVFLLLNAGAFCDSTKPEITESQESPGRRQPCQYRWNSPLCNPEHVRLEIKDQRVTEVSTFPNHHSIPAWPPLRALTSLDSSLYLVLPYNCEFSFFTCLWSDLFCDGLMVSIAPQSQRSRARYLKPWREPSLCPRLSILVCYSQT